MTGKIITSHSSPSTCSDSDATGRSTDSTGGSLAITAFSAR